ncbi:hypothetical protein HMPREF3216_00281 [Gardnerella vaginalis]|uniref:Lipoprotein n=1 Tax=Gardnerella vaginalis TaxID=2702 RepID=A0A133NRJ1_GARVA|nr:hypothetical protein HMPREF3216_00281 [Gardnerella vaginalis]
MGLRFIFKIFVFLDYLCFWIICGLSLIASSGCLRFAHVPNHPQIALK